jgi:hypothetical protein
MMGRCSPNHPHPNPPPQARERERGALLSSLSRLRGRVARSSERDGWGPARLPMTGKG